jgi:protein-disulfide isomerase
MTTRPASVNATEPFWEMYELLLQTSSHLNTDSLVTYARLLDLDVAQVRSDLASHAYAARIERHVQEGIRNGVNATPKFYVNRERAHRRQGPVGGPGGRCSRGGDSRLGKPHH